MMKLLDYRFVGVALFVFAGFDVKADGLRIDVSGVYSKDPNFGKSFGSSEAELLFSMSLLIDESQGFYLPAGTPLMSGQPAAEDGVVFPASAVTRLSATLGDLQWTEEHVRALPPSDLGVRPGIILMGDPDSNGVKIYCMIASIHDGALSLTHLICEGSGCRLDNGAWGQDYRTGSHGQISNLAVSIRQQ